MVVFFRVKPNVSFEGLLDPVRDPGLHLPSARMKDILGIMWDLLSLGAEIARRRKKLNLSQTALARNAGVSRATLDALENGRAGEMGYSRLTRLLAAVGLELKLQAARSQRPTLDELIQENRDDQSMDRRG